jgi:hypothetical protein
MRIAGKTLVPLGGMWSTTNTEAARSSGSSATSAPRASTPPAEAPMTTMSCPLRSESVGTLLSIPAHVCGSSMIPPLRGG